MRHKVIINVSEPGGKNNTVLKGAETRLPTRLLRWLFGGYSQVYLLSPGQTVESVDVKEIKEDRR